MRRAESAPTSPWTASNGYMIAHALHRLQGGHVPRYRGLNPICARPDGLPDPDTTGPGIIIYGYVKSKDYWRLGAIFEVIYIAALLYRLAYHGHVALRRERALTHEGYPVPLPTAGEFFRNAGPSVPVVAPQNTAPDEQRQPQGDEYRRRPHIFGATRQRMMLATDPIHHRLNRTVDDL